MATYHTAEKMVTAKLVGGLRFGDEQDVLADADLATTLAAAKAAVDTANGKLHTSQRTFGARVKAALDMVGDYDATYIGGSDVDKATMLAVNSSVRNGSITPRY